MQGKNETSKVHVLFHSKCWHVWWNLYYKHRHFGIKFYHIDAVYCEYMFRISFGAGEVVFTYSPRVRNMGKDAVNAQ